MLKGVLGERSGHCYLKYIVCVCERLEGSVEKDSVSLWGSPSQTPNKLDTQSEEKTIGY